jgi:hypothetical protein
MLDTGYRILDELRNVFSQSGIEHLESRIASLKPHPFARPTPVQAGKGKLC